jgi:putative addiction module component (TIGR02574 family)
MTTPSQVLDAALGLNPDQRADIAHQLLLSLEPDDIDEDADQAWAAEIRRRLQAIREGRILLRDWDEALTGIRQILDSTAKA